MIDALRHKNIWTTTYRGVSIEIVNWFMYMPHNKQKPVWNYYLVIPEQSVPPDQRNKIFLKGTWERLLGGRPKLSYDYMRSELLCGLNWHGGITYYDIEGGLCKSPRIVKVGCDYLHYWDERLESSYDEKKLLQDAQETVDDLREALPNLRYRCSYFGTWHNKSDGIISKNGTFTSKEGLIRKKVK